jgi:4-amino-4-deoxy-L-arabinose transferase-like glycosyltransferase
MTVAFQTLNPPRAAAVGARARALVRGRPADPVWVRPSVLALLGATALLYLYDLSASGWANSFYAAAVQAGSQSWKAMFFGSSDASSFITVDKPPASLWVMDVSARLFGVNAWSLLVPQALEGVASVGVLYLAVRRVASPAAALLAGAVLATTPVAALMFRFDNPDALLVLALTAATYAVVRSLETASTRWLALAGALIGLGFLTKMLQAVLIVPVLAVVYLVAAPTPLGRRVRQVLWSSAAMVVAAGWWIAIVELWPAGSRPYIGGSQSNSILELTLGYNGLGRLTGNETGSVGGGGLGTGRWGATGLLRLFNSEYAGMASWLLPTALVLLLGALVVAWSSKALRWSLLLWGGWLVVTGLVFSLMKGIVHPYYTVALAPALGGVIGLGALALWERRERLLARGFLAAALAVTALWTHTMMLRAATWHPTLRSVLLLALLAAAALVLWLPSLDRRFAVAVAVVGLVGSLTAPALASVATAATPHTGSIPTVAPAVAGGGMGGLGGPPGGFRGGAPGGPGGLLNASTPNADLVALLSADSSSYTWVAAAIGSNSAAGPQLATGLPVMALGGFNGSDPTPTLAAFQALVAQGKVHYFLGGGNGGGPGMGSSGTSAQITAWVAATFTAQTVGGVTVYDLTSPA